MDGGRAFRVTMVRPSTGLPSFEVGAYEYVGGGLPFVGSTISIRRILGAETGETERGFVTRLNPASDAPIVVTAVAGETETETETETTADDYLVA